MKISISYRLYYFLALIWLLSQTVEARSPINGNLLTYRLIGVYGRDEIKALLSQSGQKAFGQLIQKQLLGLTTAKNRVKVFKITYQTTHFNGQTIIASGSVAIPHPAAGSYPLIGYQHSTELERKLVPSNFGQSAEAQGVVIVLACYGYVVSLPDYIGQGESPVMHPFFHADTEALASLDMLKATRTLCRKMGVRLNGKLFLSGFSQGGHATMALHRFAQHFYPGQFQVTAASLIAGVYDLPRIWQHYFLRPNWISSLLIARMIVAYQQIYKLGLSYSKIFRPPWDRTVETLMKGDMPALEVLKAFPEKLTDLLLKEFWTQMNAGTHPFYKFMRTNNVYDWFPKAPIRLYYSLKDEVVPYQQSLLTFQHLKQLGAKIQTARISRELSHAETFIPALLASRKWFDSF